MSPFFVALSLTDVLLLTILVTSPARVWWWAKLAAMIVVLAFNFAAWSAVDSGRGWSLRASLPEHTQYISCQIVEPDEATHTVGAIYVWAIPLDFKHGLLSYRPQGQEPRAYAEPYDRSLHEACVAASKAAQQGIPATIRRNKGRRGPTGKPTPGTYHAYVLPRPSLPQKQ